MINNHKFISFEGMDGVGKTTQIKKLATYLKQHGQKVILTREPGGTEFSETIRSLVLNSKKMEQILTETEVILMYAARLEHTKKVIIPALKKENWVLCDRYTDSTRVYQGYAGGIEQSFISKIDQIILNGFTPELTFIFDMDLNLSKQRLKERDENITYYESKHIEFQTKIRKGFLSIVKANPKRCVLIEAKNSILDISKKINMIINEKYGI